MKKSTLLLIQSVLCILSAVTLIAADLVTYFEGIRTRSDNPMADIYSADAIKDNIVWALPFLFAAIIVTIICAFLNVKAPKTGNAADNIYIRKNTPDGKLSPASVNIVRAVLFLVAVVFIIIGIFNGSLDDVFIKAAKICTECIGLG